MPTEPSVHSLRPRSSRISDTRKLADLFRRKAMKKKRRIMPHNQPKQPGNAFKSILKPYLLANMSGNFRKTFWGTGIPGKSRTHSEPPTEAGGVMLRARANGSENPLNLPCPKPGHRPEPIRVLRPHCVYLSLWMCELPLFNQR